MVKRFFTKENYENNYMGSDGKYSMFIDLVKMEAKQIKSKIDEALPDVRNRNQVTMHIEGERSYDKLYTDIEKAQELIKMQRSIAKQQNIVRGLEQKDPSVLRNDETSRDVSRDVDALYLHGLDVKKSSKRKIILDEKIKKGI
jgi:hypothetical protein